MKNPRKHFGEPSDQTIVKNVFSNIEGSVKCFVKINRHQTGQVNIMRNQTTYVKGTKKKTQTSISSSRIINDPNDFV